MYLNVRKLCKFNIRKYNKFFPGKKKREVNLCQRLAPTVHPAKLFCKNYFNT